MVEYFSDYSKPFPLGKDLDKMVAILWGLFRLYLDFQFSDVESEMELQLRENDYWIFTFENSQDG